MQKGSVQFENPAAVSSKKLKKVVFGAAIGNTIEWFDYATYTYLATIISAVFFTSLSQTAALLGTFGVFAVSFVARPFGGIFWGHFGDKIGRKRVLILTITIMSSSTFLIGLLPSFTSIGILSPILLLCFRLVQGFSASGEYAGSASFIAEHSPKSKRGILVCMVPAGTAAGLMLGSLIASILEFSLTKDALHLWGWRIPFLMACPLGLFGLYIRLKLEDTAVFKELKDSQQIRKSPLKAGIVQYWKQILIAVIVVCLNAVGFYIILTYMPTYLSEELGFSRAASTFSTIFSLVTYVLFLPIVGSLSDKIGRKTMLMSACGLIVFLTWPLFMLLSLGGFFAITAQVLLGFILAGNDGVLATFLSETFPTSIRFTGFGVSFNLSNAIFGGTAPFMATLLISTTGNTFAPAFYLIAASIVAFIALLFTKETVNKSLRDT